MYFKRSKFLIVGISKSGFSACKLLLSKGAECYVFDHNQNGVNQNLIEELLSLGAKSTNRENIEDVISLCDVVILSPGIPIDNEIPILARRMRKNIIGEVELGSYFTKGAIVGVTGTNGKTTTCSLIDYILKKAQFDSFLVGNIGTPICKECEKTQENSISVVEVSSYQLETIAKFAPHIACVINISPDHLSRHYNMENYIYLKSRILRNLRESEYAVLNADDQRIKEFSTQTRGKAIYFSMVGKVEGAYLLENKIYWNGDLILDAGEIALKGGHNIQNALVAVCVCKLLGVEKQIIADGLRTFKGVKHRIQVIESDDGITYINDSKATNPNSTISAISMMKERFILLLGGREKGGGYEELFNKIKENRLVKEVILYGEARYFLYEISKKEEIGEVCVVNNLQRAVRLALSNISKGEVLLLSPACASFDEFEGYEERGERFIELINEHIGKNA